MHTTASCPKRAACCAGSTPFAVSAEPCRLLGYTRAVRTSGESSQSSASPASIPLPPPLAQETPQHPALDGVGVDSPSPGCSSALSQFGLGRWDVDPNFGCHHVPKRGWQVTSAKGQSAASRVLLSLCWWPCWWSRFQHRTGMETELRNTKSCFIFVSCRLES